MISIGQVVPEYSAVDLHGREHALGDVRASVLVLIFWSAECPWSQRADDLIAAWRPAWGEEVALWMIASNANEGIELLRDVAAERQLEVVLVDADHRLADQFGALTTPHCFVIDQDGVLRYRGGIDDTSFRQREATRMYLNDAVRAVLEGRVVEPADTPGYGCTIVRLSSSANST